MSSERCNLQIAAPAPASASVARSSETFVTRLAAACEHAHPVLADIPDRLSLSPDDAAPRRTLGKLLAGPQRREVKRCAKECVSACSSGGAGTRRRCHNTVIASCGSCVAHMRWLLYGTMLRHALSEIMQQSLNLRYSARQAPAGVATAGAQGEGTSFEFESGYRSRQYCIRECSNVCATRSDERADKQQ